MYPADLSYLKSETVSLGTFLLVSHLTTVNMQDGEWKRELTQEELDWIQPLYAQMIHDAKQLGMSSDNPCRLLFHAERLEVDDKHYKVWPLNNRRGSGHRVKGGPPYLSQHWIAFVAEHRKIPKWYWRKADDDGFHYAEPDDDEDSDVQMEERKGNDKEEADGDDGWRAIIDGMMSAEEEERRNRNRNRNGSGNGKEEAGDEDEEKEDDDDDDDDPNFIMPCELSHLCGNNLCIAPGHIVCEWQCKNSERQSCHFLIKKLYAEIVGIDPTLKDRKVTMFECDHILNSLTLRSGRKVNVRACGHTPSCFINFGEEEQDVKDRKRRLSVRPGFVHPQRRKRRRVGSDEKVKGRTIYCDIAGNEVYVKGWVGDIDGDHIIFCHQYKDGNGKCQRDERRVPTKSSLLKWEL